MRLNNLQAALIVTAAICAAEENPYRHTLVLDSEGTMVLDWFADIAKSTIYFNITAQTQGYIAFGITNKGRMLGADIVMGGVYSNGTSYFTDRHGINTGDTDIDASQDWNLLLSWESTTHTFLSFSRPFETCDKTNDQPINDNVVELIWYYSQVDDISPPYSHRGRHLVYLLDPDLTPKSVNELSNANVTQPQHIEQLGDFGIWNLKFDVTLPAQDTAYLCTFHKPPTKTKQHIIGFRTVLNGSLERQHVHHYLLFLCRAPKGINADALFGRHIGRPGQECYSRFGSQNTIPTQYCLEPRYAWAIGGGATFFPDHVGIPLTESEDEYYMLQVHHDNPLESPNLRLQYSLEIFYTPKLRQHDGGAFYFGAPNPFPGATSIVVPPNDTNHIIYGHCASGCTQKMFPKSGINLIAGMLHLHFAGKGFRALHIHNKQESAIITDDNINPYYQPNRIFRNEHNILPGDMVVIRCIYDTTNRNYTTIAGYSARNEMCNLFSYYYPLMRNYGGCTGDLESDAYRSTLQIYNTIWSDEKRDEVVTSPQSSAGLTVSESLSRVHWDHNLRTQLQTHHRFLPQLSRCPNTSPDIPRQLLQQTPSSNDVLREYYKNIILGSSPVTLTNLNDEIDDPESEFISLWPKDLSFYRPPTKCSA